jgi:hypothetical protein
MSNTREQNQARKSRLVAAIVFVLLAGMGHAVSSQVEGAVGPADAVADHDTGNFPSECTSHGLTLPDCFEDF